MLVTWRSATERAIRALQMNQKRSGFPDCIKSFQVSLVVLVKKFKAMR